MKRIVEKRAHSIKGIALRYFILLMAVVLLCLMMSSAYSVWVYREQLSYCNEATQAVARNNLAYTLEGLAEFNLDTANSDADFSVLSYGGDGISVQQRLSSLYHLRRSIQGRVPTAGAYLLFDRSESIFYYCLGSQFRASYMTLPDMEFMHALAREIRTRPDDWLARWQVVTVGGSTVLTDTCRNRNLYICAILDLESFAQAYTAGTDSIHYAFYVQDAILTGGDYLASQGIGLEELLDPPEGPGGLWPRRDLIQSEFLPQYGVGLAAVIPVTGIWSWSRAYGFIALGALACILLTILAVYSVLKRALIYPLDEIARASQRLAGSGEPEAPANDAEPAELAAIRAALDRLVEQKVELTRENENRMQERNHAMLQYYQLQTRSHFILNCLKSIYSMTEKGEAEKTKRMIMLFSNHLRYIFHDTLSLITLQAELAEVRDYYQIIQLDRRSPVMLSVEVPPELLSVRVPPLTIQTFIENSYKYNNDENKLLVFHIQADRIRMEDRDYLRLRLGDNGKGYSPEILEALEGPGELYGTHHVGISNLRRRINILYGGDYQMGFCNATDGGAITVIYLPMETGEKEDT